MPLVTVKDAQIDSLTDQSSQYDSLGEYPRKLFHQKSYMLETYPGLRQIAFDNTVCTVHHKLWPSYEMAVVLHSSHMQHTANRALGCITFIPD